MQASQSNRDLLAAWKQGDQAAAELLVRRFMIRLTAFVRNRLATRLARRIDAEDVVLSAWRSVFVAAQNSRLTLPADEELWPFLVAVTHRKLARQVSRHFSGRRDVRREISLTDGAGPA